MVPAEELNAALKRMKDISSLTINENNIVIKSGRLTSTIKSSDYPVEDLEKIPTNWLPFPPGLIEALKLVKPFVGDRPGTDGIRLMEDRVTGTSGSALLDVKVKGFAFEGQVLMPVETAEFLIIKGAPNEYAQEERFIFFRWEDGRIVRTRLIDNKFPHELVEKIHDTAGTKAPIKITQEWIEAGDDVEALCDEVFLLDPSGFKGFKGAATYEMAIDTGLPKNHSSSWSIKYLKPVLACAEAWNPMSYPGPTFFKGKNLRGVVMGYRK